MRRSFIESRAFFRDTRHLLISLGWFVVAEIIILILLALVLPGVSFGRITPDLIVRGLVAAIVLAAANFAIVPVLLWLRVPFNIVTVGLITFGVNLVLLYLAADLLPDLEMDASAATVLPAAAFLAFGNVIVNGLIALDDDYTYMRFVIRTMRDGGRDLDRAPDHRRRGMVLLEIDGLSYERMKRAIDTGVMPAVSTLATAGRHELTRFDCGLPSQTSACQAGIMYGDNEDIPAFRWYSKRAGRTLVSNNLDDASFINFRHSTGRGLLRGGASINNLINGDAARSLLTLSTISGATSSKLPTQRALDTLMSFWLNPYTFGRTLALCVADLAVEITQALRQRITDRRPRLDHRFPSAYTGLRVLTNVLLRDLSIYAVMQEILRGAPVIYTTFVGYDEVAHHAGPDTADAMNTLKGFDRHVRHVVHTIRYLAPFHYDLFILSDHGQSAGATFKQRYGRSLRETIDELTHHGVRVAEQKPVEAGHSFVNALVGELNAASREPQTRGRQRIRRATMRATARTLARVEKRQKQQPVSDGNDIVVCASGNLAHVYFNSIGDGRVRLREIGAAHPGLVDTLIEHPGIGLVIVADDDGHVLVLSRDGARDLSTGAITGNDPLAPYGLPDLRAEQLLRLARFESAGDLILNSTLFADGSVAAFEELVGSHGGLGGQQTDAFLFHPRAEHVPGTIANSAEVYGVLEEWRERST
jgi:uncharacterized membrane protein YvlD (DUF360 family)